MIEGIARKIPGSAAFDGVVTKGFERSHRTLSHARIGSTSLLRRISLHSASPSNVGNFAVDHFVVFAGSDLQLGILSPGDQSHDDSRGSDRRCARRRLLRRVGFFSLQHPDVAFGGGAIDWPLQRRLIRLVLRGAPRRESSNRQTISNLGQILFLHVLLPLFKKFFLIRHRRRHPRRAFSSLRLANFLAQFQNMYIGPWSNTGRTRMGRRMTTKEGRGVEERVKSVGGRVQDTSVDNLSPSLVSVSLR